MQAMRPSARVPHQVAVRRNINNGRNDRGNTFAWDLAVLLCDIGPWEIWQRPRAAAQTHAFMQARTQNTQSTIWYYSRGNLVWFELTMNAASKLRWMGYIIIAGHLCGGDDNVQNTSEARLHARKFRMCTD